MTHHGELTDEQKAQLLEAFGEARDSFRSVWGNLREQAQRFVEVMAGTVTDQLLIRMAIEKCGITEADIRKVDRRTGVVYLRNWRWINVLSGRTGMFTYRHQPGDVTLRYDTRPMAKPISNPRTYEQQQALYDTYLKEML